MWSQGSGIDTAYSGWWGIWVTAIVEMKADVAHNESPEKLFKNMAFQAPPQTNEIRTPLQNDPRWSAEACPAPTGREEQHLELLGWETMVS